MNFSLHGSISFGNNNRAFSSELEQARFSSYRKCYSWAKVWISNRVFCGHLSHFTAISGQARRYACNLYIITVLKSPLRRCQLWLYSAFRLLCKNECKFDDAKEMEGRFFRIHGGFVAPFLFPIQLSQVLFNLFRTPKAWKCLPPLKEEPRLKR